MIDADVMALRNGMPAPVTREQHDDAWSALNRVGARLAAADHLAEALLESVDIGCDEFYEDEGLTCPEKWPDQRTTYWCTPCDVRFLVAAYTAPIQTPNP